MRRFPILLFFLLFLPFSFPKSAFADKAAVQFGNDATTTPYIDATNSFGGTATASAMLFRVNGTEMMRVTSSGNVGIGTTSPTALLHVTQDGTTNYYVKLGDTAASTNRFVIDGNGNVGIGTMNPSYTLHVVSSSQAGYFTGSAGLYASGSVGRGVYAHTNSTSSEAIVGEGPTCYGWLGWSNYSAGGNCNTSFASDKRLKKDIEPVQNGLNVVLKLRPVSYLWKTDRKNHDLETNKSKKAHSYGFIAQDVMKVLPDLVTEKPSLRTESAKPSEATKKSEKSDEIMYGLDYNGFIAPTVAAVQELNEKIERLKAENETLRVSDKELRTRLDTLETRFQMLEAKANPGRAGAGSSRRK